jgi:metallo-beta-lactamase class B
MYPGSDNLAYSSPAVLVDEKVAHEQVITHGDITLKANITPGHTPGCTSWSTNAKDASEEYQVLFFCSASVAGNRLVGPPQYPGIVEDYRLTFERTRNWTPDVFLSNHPFFFDMHAKREKQLAGEKLAFVDRSGFPTSISELEVAFEKALKAQLGKPKQSSIDR